MDMFGVGYDMMEEVYMVVHTANMAARLQIYDNSAGNIGEWNITTYWYG